MNNNMLDKLLLPFIFIYKGFISILLIPYYFVLGFIKIFGLGKKTKQEKKVIPEIKKGEQIKVIKEVRSAYDKPVVTKKETNPVILSNEKIVDTKKRQKEFEKLVAKARDEEKRRIKEQEKLRIEKEIQAKAEEAKKLEEQKREAIIEEENAKKLENEKENGKPITFSDKIKAFYKKLTFNKKEAMELEAKKVVMDESLKDKKDEAERLKKPLLFKYIARNANGELEKSSIEALSRVDVYSFLEAEGYEIYDIVATKSSSSIKLGMFKFKKSKLIFYLSQLSAYLKSGIALSDAIKILDNQAKNINEKKTWRAIYYDLSMGDVLSTAMEKRGEIFPKLLINMIKTAEMTGNLPETLDDMVNYYTESEQTRKQMKTAMTYPTVVTVFAIAVITFILLWVVPQFQDIYKDLGSDMPGITLFVINVSNFLKNYLLYIAIGIIIFILIYMYLFKNIKSFRTSMQDFAMHLPVFGNIIIYNEVTIFTKTFANLINHNVFITDSMDVLSKITNNEIYKKLIFDTARNLTKGDSLSSAFKDHWAFPNIAYQMLLTGEKTGRLGPMMERVSSYYQEQHRTIINQMKTLIEPILIVSLAVIVGGILLSVVIPMYGMYNGLQ